MGWKIEDRLWLLLKESVGERHSWKALWEWLAGQSTVSAGRWRNFYSGHQKASTDMVEAASKLWPQYAFWLATGITDAANGHIAPVTALVFPEHSYDSSEESNTYFRRSLELVETLAQRANVSQMDDELRRQMIERLCVFGTWTASGLLSEAYRLSSTGLYIDYKQAWEQREVKRNEHVGNLRREKPQVQGQVSPASGIDERAKHQSKSELFYRVNDST